MNIRKPAPVHWINRLRVLAAFGVVCLHVSEAIVRDTSRHPSAGWIAANFCDAAVRWAVPVFVMISGVLLLDPSKNESIGTFYRKRARRILLPYIFWSLAYLAVRTILIEPVSAKQWAIRLLNGRAQAHMWYVHMIIGLYLATPLLRWFVRRVKRRTVWIIAILVLTTAAIWRYLDFFGSDSDPFILTALFVPYMGYFLLGWLLSQTPAQKSVRRLAIGVMLVCIAVIGAGTVPLVGEYGLWKGAYLYTYFSPPVIVCSIMLFLWAKENHSESKNALHNLVARVAPATFGIYLIHPLVIQVFKTVGFSSERFAPAISIPLVSLSAFAVSAIAVNVIMRVPFVRRIVG